MGYHDTQQSQTLFGSCGVMRAKAGAQGRVRRVGFQLGNQSKEKTDQVAMRLDIDPRNVQRLGCLACSSDRFIMNLRKKAHSRGLPGSHKNIRGCTAHLVLCTEA